MGPPVDRSPTESASFQNVKEVFRSARRRGCPVVHELVDSVLDGVEVIVVARPRAEALAKHLAPVRTVLLLGPLPVSGRLVDEREQQPDAGGRAGRAQFDVGLLDAAARLDDPHRTPPGDDAPTLAVGAGDGEAVPLQHVDRGGKDDADRRVDGARRAAGMQKREAARRDHGQANQKSGTERGGAKWATRSERRTKHWHEKRDSRRNDFFWSRPAVPNRNNAARRRRPGVTVRARQGASERVRAHRGGAPAPAATATARRP